MTIEERSKALDSVHKSQADILRALNNEYEDRYHCYQGQLSHYMTGIESGPKAKQVLSAIDNELIPRWKHENIATA